MDNAILLENAKLREALAKIGGFANSWAGQYRDCLIGINLSSVINQFESIEQTCKSALEQPAPPLVPLTYVTVGGQIFAGMLVDDNPEGFEGCVEIEIVGVDPTCARMRVIGTPTGEINKTPVVEGKIK